MTSTPIQLTIERALREGSARLVHSKTPGLDARVLLKAATNFDDAALIARAHEKISDAHQGIFFGFIARRQKG